MIDDRAGRQSRLSPEQRAALEKRIRDAAQASSAAVRIRPRSDPGGLVPLSSAQQRLWVLDQLMPASPWYNVTRTVRIDGPLDASRLQEALRRIVSRHESLRTVFLDRGGEPFQRILNENDFELSVVSFAGLPESEREAAALDRAQEDAALPFDLTRTPLLRALLLELGPERHIFHVTAHHIVTDGWSMEVLFREISALYPHTTAHRNALPELPLQYADYCLWQKDWLASPEARGDVARAAGHLEGAPVLDLPLDRPRPGMPTLRGAQRTRVLAPALRTRLESLARSEGATLFMVLLAAYEVFLHRHSGQDDISVATPIAGRTLPELEPLIGFFANTLVLRGDLSGDPTFRQLVRRVREAALDAYSYQGVPLEKVVETLRPERHLAQNPLAQALFVLQNTPGSALRLPGARVTMLELETRTSRFDLELHVRETDEGLACLMIASADLFEEETVTRLLERFEVLLSGIVENPDSSIAELPLLSSSERRRLVVEWNETDLDIGPLRCIHEIIEEQAARTPEAPAVVGWQETLSYRELDSRASRLAARLRREGIGPEKIAAVCLDRTPDLVAALLAIWKSGGAYVPLDPSYPADRLLYMLEDSGASAVIVEPRIVPLLGGGGRPLIILGKEPEANSPEASGGPEARAHPENLAYVLYTSGSTGRPKGVAIEHRNTFAFIRWAETIFPPERLSGVFASTSVSFDLSIFELFLPLCSGGTVILGRDALDLGQHPARDRVTLVNTVPSAIAEIVRLEAMPASLQTVNLAGEPLSPELASNVYASGPVEDVYNLYGPTEATTYSTFTRVPRANAGSVTIGRPIANTQVYLLDARMQTAPIGVAGELCIGGAGVARGYLGRAELTAEKFVPDTFRGQGSLYRTGDLARYRSNGEIEYLGRRDGQVKIRGFRIETGEIESQIRRYPGVHEVAVAAHSQSGTGVRLVAYVVRKENATISVPELKRALKRQLPDPMIPAAFVFLDALPLTPNGKVDRRALPDPGSERPEFLESYTAPRDDTEIALASIWQSLLGLERVGVFDNFFELGGHSLLATQLISRVRDRFSVDLPLRLLFESPTVAELAAAVAHAPSARSGGRIVRQDRAGRPAGG